MSIEKSQKKKKNTKKREFWFANKANMARFASGETEKWRDREGESERKASEIASWPGGRR